MEKINSIDSGTPPASEDFAVMGRKAVVMKRFFVWIATWYFVTALMAGGGMFPTVSVPLAKAGKLVLFFAVCVLIDTLVANALVQAGPKYARFRPLSLGIMAILFILALLSASPVFR